MSKRARKKKRRSKLLKKKLKLHYAILLKNKNKTKFLKRRILEINTGGDAECSRNGTINAISSVFLDFDNVAEENHF